MNHEDKKHKGTFPRHTASGHLVPTSVLSHIFTFLGTKKHFVVTIQKCIAFFFKNNLRSTKKENILVKSFFIATLFFLTLTSLLTFTFQSQAFAFQGVGCPVSPFQPSYQTKDDKTHEAPCTEPRQPLADTKEQSLCHNLLDAPISTFPSLFAKYQAKKGANQVFTRLNQIYRELRSDLAAKQNQDGFKKTSHQRKQKFNLNVIEIAPLTPPKAVIEAYFNHFDTKRAAQFACHISYDGYDLCQGERRPEPIELSVKSRTTCLTPAYQIKLPEADQTIIQLTSSLQTSISCLQTQTIHEVALPPPEPIA